VVEAWRICKSRYASTAFDGEGARQYGGRWSSVGTRVVYSAGSRSIAILETLTRLESIVPLPAFVIVSAGFDPSLVERLDPGDLAANWRVQPPSPVTQVLGDAWVESGRSAVLKVPSVVVPEESNFLINPAHQDFRKVRIGRPQPLEIDPRLAQQL
jgi:RES domain-containing protein